MPMYFVFQAVIEVAACSNAHILLTQRNYVSNTNDGNIIEINIGGWSNTKSTIRYVLIGKKEVQFGRDSVRAVHNCQHFHL